MPFSKETTTAAWNRQDGKCAYCGKTLDPINREQTEFGAWNTHHRKPEREGGTNTLRNCVILCVNQSESCHFNIGHGGVSWDYYKPLRDSELPFLDYGIKSKYIVISQNTRRIAEPARKPTRNTKKPIRRKYHKPNTTIPRISIIRGIRGL